jgi:tRNA pseudouridine38-40 synthase
LRTYALTIAYDGRAYGGWQRQQGFDTIQERLERAFAVLHGEPIAVHGAGRTDRGVHALRQCAHVRLGRAWAPGLLVRALNGNLPRDIRVRDAREVSPRFHARFSARGKRYAYRFALGPEEPLFRAGQCWWIRRPLDPTAMRAAAVALRGRHDFAAFATNPGYERRHGTVRTIRHVHLVRRPRGLDLVLQGDGFLYNMVRAIAGTLVEVGLGRRDPADLARVLASRDRREAGPNAPAQGLFLVRVLYPRELLRTGATAPGG